MKRLLLILCLVVSFSFASGVLAQASEVDILVQKLVEKNVLSPSEAQIILDDTKVQVAKDLAHGELISAPDWTQRIKVSGDVRFRTQYDSGKGASSTGTDSNTAGAVINDNRWRERLRGRIGVEAKVNDDTYAGVRFMGGGPNSNTGNDTLGGSGPFGAAGTTAAAQQYGYFNKYPVMWDQYWIRYEAPKEFFGKLYNDLKLWAGKMPNPMQTTDLMWDNNITPGGVAIQYTSPDVKLSSIPSFNIYSNLGSFVLDENATWQADPMLWVGQIGVKTSPFGLCGSTLNLGTAFYNFANIKGRVPSANSAGTNTRQWLGNQTDQITTVGPYMYEYNVLDLLMIIDNGSLFGYDLPNGLYADFIHNTAAPKNNGVLLGAYLGKKSLKEKNDWKVRAEWRYIERDALPDFMTDNDWYGFGTQSSVSSGSTFNQNGNGFPAQNGTNGKGVVLASEYMILKNTSLNLKYSWMEPVISDNKTDPWNEFMCDVITKF